MLTIIKQNILAIFVFLFGIWFCSIRLLGNFDYVPGDLGDARFINFLLEHGYQYIIGNHESFWQAPFMFPYERTIAISDNMLGTLPIYSLFRFTGATQETAYQLWWVVIMSLNFWSAYWVIKKYFNRTDVAILIAWIFAFTVFNIGQINYVQMMIRFPVPLAIYGVIKLIETGHWKYYALALFSITLQFYAVIYTGLFLFYFAAGFGLLYVLISKNWKNLLALVQKPQLLYTSLSTVLSVLLLWWLLAPYLVSAKEHGLKPFEEVLPQVPLWTSYLYVSEPVYFLKWQAQMFKPNTTYFYLHDAFTGWIPTLVMLSMPFIVVIGMWKKLKVNHLVLALSLTVVGIVCFYLRSEDGKSIYYLVYKLPGMGSLRVLNRHMHVTLFLILVAVTWWLKDRKAYVVWLLIGFAIIESTITPEKIIRDEKSFVVNRRLSNINEVKTALHNSPNKNLKAFVILDTVETVFLTQLDAMAVTNYINLPTINGYSSTGPKGFESFFIKPGRKELLQWLEFNNMKEEDVLIIDRNKQ